MSQLLSQAIPHVMGIHLHQGGTTTKMGASHRNSMSCVQGKPASGRSITEDLIPPTGYHHLCLAPDSQISWRPGTACKSYIRATFLLQPDTSRLQLWTCRCEGVRSQPWGSQELQPAAGSCPGERGRAGHTGLPASPTELKAAAWKAQQHGPQGGLGTAPLHTQHHQSCLSTPKNPVNLADAGLGS